MSKLNYWKPLAALAVVGLLFGAWQADRKAEYRRGRDEMSAEISAKLKDSFVEQEKQSREKEKKTAAAFVARQVELEKENKMLKKLMLICALSLTACANTPPIKVAAETCPQPLHPPAHLMVKKLPKAGSFSESARLNMQEWQK